MSCHSGSFYQDCFRKKSKTKHARFWDAEGNRKYFIFTFNLRPHNHIHIAKYLFSIRDE